MNEADEENTGPRDKRFVAIGVAMLAFGLFGIVYFDERVPKYLCIMLVLVAFLAMRQRLPER